ncbi:hypothetical protein BDW42DRAFT_168134 [Aspergillus taichungensis]|uniref:Uncharacterized protein n=1 Tax=Aspergillus taichungensis TaxID=482145 RepID=A0A2J5HWD7_9EURO|nr:hypothetical protein BDW42DRAFT_168134 [Aspergillus taichungensis]
MTDFHLSRPSLTTNDSAVLQALFDAESSPSSAVTIDPSLPPFPPHLHITAETYEGLKARELAIIRTLQPSDVSPETIRSALQNLDALITEHPTYPPAYMNRAQAQRLLITTTTTTPATTQSSNDDADEQIFIPANASAASALFDDLGRTIAYATPKSPADAVSTVQARVLADAHTHRAYLLLKLKRARQDGSDGGPEKLKGCAPEEIEEMASRDFFLGGRFGNKVAQQMAVQTNPYAKMCGAIVKEALRKEVEG